MSDIKKLAAHFESIQNVALAAHETMERESRIPILDLETGLLGPNRCFNMETRAGMLWEFLIFTMPRYRLQAQFQMEISRHITDSETALIIRQLRNRAPRIWSYRKTYDNGFAHTLSGPNKHNEIALEGCLHADGRINKPDHIYAFGWTLTFKDKIYLVCADELTQEQAYAVEKLHPFPVPQNEDDFWEESFRSILDIIYTSQPIITLNGRIVSETTDYAPERRFSRLQKILIAEISPVVIRKPASLMEFVATHEAGDIVAHVDKIIDRNTTSRDTETAAYLRRRILEAVGCDDGGRMPCAHISILTSDPAALLGLPDDHPMFKHIGIRDSIKQALAFDEENGITDAADAFRIYRRERRWLASFPCFDLTNEDHAARFGIPVDTIRSIFAPELLSSALPIVPQGDVLRQLQTKFEMYAPDAEPPCFIDVLEALTSRQFSRTGNMSIIAQWLVHCCERWRYCKTQIDPDTSGTTRTVSRSNQKLLKKGLTQLADMFKKS